MFAESLQLDLLMATALHLLVDEDLVGALEHLHELVVVCGGLALQQLHKRRHHLLTTRLALSPTCHIQ